LPTSVSIPGYPDASPASVLVLVAAVAVAVTIAAVAVVVVVVTLAVLNAEPGGVVGVDRPAAEVVAADGGPACLVLAEAIRIFGLRDAAPAAS
jgi:hypothetical protein